MPKKRYAVVKFDHDGAKKVGSVVRFDYDVPKKHLSVVKVVNCVSKSKSLINRSGITVKKLAFNHICTQESVVITQNLFVSLLNNL
jgi:hypothetical protein